MAIEDFNAIFSTNEKTSGLSPGKRCPHFWEFMDSVDLIDLGFKGPLFTWHQGNLFERLDRALANEAWFRNFPNSSITHLSKIKSDLRPLLLVLKPKIIWPRGRPFRFLASGSSIQFFEILLKTSGDSKPLWSNPYIALPRALKI